MTSKDTRKARNRYKSVKSSKDLPSERPPPKILSHRPARTHRPCTTHATSANSPSAKLRNVQRQTPDQEINDKPRQDGDQRTRRRRGHDQKRPLNCDDRSNKHDRVSRLLTTTNNDGGIITKSSETCQRLAATLGMTGGGKESPTPFTASHAAIEPLILQGAR